jgi:RNA polymerase sigma factor (sigma-70 family)
MWPDSRDTQELLALARDSDAEAVDRVLARHRGAVRRMIRLRMDPVLGRRVDASDVVQEVLVEAHRRLRSYLKNPTMPFHLWLRQIAKDRLIDARRRHRVAARRSIDREQPLDVRLPRDQSTRNLTLQLCDRQLTPAPCSPHRWRWPNSSGAGSTTPVYSQTRRVGRANLSVGGTSAASSLRQSQQRDGRISAGLRRPTNELRGLVPPYMNNPGYGISLYGVVAAATYFLPGWKYYRQSRAQPADRLSS